VRVRVGVGAGILLLSVLEAVAQDAPGRLAPAEATNVLVDVVVRDKKGQPVVGLTAAHFEVLEDGVSQRIGQFSLKGPEVWAHRLQLAPARAGLASVLSVRRLVRHVRCWVRKTI
jgi:hypothetical protein